MARVDPDDDAIQRWVVRHYRYDPDRRERRHVVVAAFDNPDEYHAEIEERAEQLRDRRQRGEPVDSVEHITGQMYEAGYRRSTASRRLLHRAMKRGHALTDPRIELPTDGSFIQSRPIP